MKKTFLLILIAATATDICRASSYASELKKFFIESGTAYYDEELAQVLEEYEKPEAADAIFKNLRTITKTND